MSYENGTTHYNLPQTVGSDKRDWFDTNQPFADIDSAIYSANQTAQAASDGLGTTNQNVTNLTGRVSDVESDVSTLQGGLATTNENLGTVSQAVNGLTTTVADNKQDLKDSICAIEEDSATASTRHEVDTFFWYNDTLYKTTVVITVGSQIVPDVNCSTTNITTELLNGGSESEIDDSVTSASKTWSSSKINTQLSTKADDSKVGDLADLDTTDKTDVVNAINELYDMIGQIGGGGMPDLNYTTPLHTFDTSSGDGHGLTYTASNTCYLVGSFQLGSSQPITLNGNDIVISSDSGVVANGFINGLKLNAGDVVVCGRQELGLHVYGLL